MRFFSVCVFPTRSMVGCLPCSRFPGRSVSKVSVKQSVRTAEESSSIFGKIREKTSFLLSDFILRSIDNIALCHDSRRLSWCMQCENNGLISYEPPFLQLAKYSPIYHPLLGPYLPYLIILYIICEHI